MTRFRPRIDACREALRQLHGADDIVTRSNCMILPVIIRHVQTH